MDSTSEVLDDSHDVGEFVIGGGTLRDQQSIIPRKQWRDSFTSDFFRRSTETRSICQKHVWNSGRVTSVSLAVRTASVESTCLFLRKTSASSVVNKHSAALFYNPNQDVRKLMRCDFECLLDGDGFKHIDIQIQRRSERHWKTPGFKDSNLRMMVTNQ